jgi:hypothetical protein
MNLYSEGAALFGSAALLRTDVYHEGKVMSIEMFEKCSTLVAGPWMRSGDPKPGITHGNCINTSPQQILNFLQIGDQTSRHNTKVRVSLA